MSEAVSETANDLQSRFVALHEFIPAAEAACQPEHWAYLIGGTETETTVARNRAALDAVALRPRVLVDVSTIDSTANVLGTPSRLPICLAPVGGLESFHKDGALAVAKGAGTFGVPMMMSSVGPRSMEEIRAATKSAVIFQLYVRGGARFIEDHVERAITAGFDAFALTVDVAVYSRRERDLVLRFDKPWRRYVNPDSERAQAALSWKDVARIRSAYPALKLIIKGIMTVEDARIAADHGVDVVYVSNHGGRQLDHGLGSVDALPDIVEALGSEARAIVDGGICRGTDIVKAIALGAHAVGIGRLYCYGLAAAGPEGIVRLLEILEDEVRSALGLTGVSSFADLGLEHVQRGAPLMTQASVHSAFPLLRED